MKKFIEFIIEKLNENENKDEDIMQPIYYINYIEKLKMSNNKYGSQEYENEIKALENTLKKILSLSEKIKQTCGNNNNYNYCSSPEIIEFVASLPEAINGIKQKYPQFNRLFNEIMLLAQSNLNSINLN